MPSIIEIAPEWKRRERDDSSDHINQPFSNNETSLLFLVGSHSLFAGTIFDEKRFAFAFCTSKKPLPSQDHSRF